MRQISSCSNGPIDGSSADTKGIVVNLPLKHLYIDPCSSVPPLCLSDPPSVSYYLSHSRPTTNFFSNYKPKRITRLTSVQWYCHHTLAWKNPYNRSHYRLVARAYPWVSCESSGIVCDHLSWTNCFGQFSQKQQVGKAEAQRGVDSFLICWTTLSICKNLYKFKILKFFPWLVYLCTGYPTH